MGLSMNNLNHILLQYIPFINAFNSDVVTPTTPKEFKITKTCFGSSYVSSSIVTMLFILLYSSLNFTKYTYSLLKTRERHYDVPKTITIMFFVSKISFISGTVYKQNLTFTPRTLFLKSAERVMRDA